MTPVAEVPPATHLSMRAAIRQGGKGLVGTLLLIGILDEFPRTAATVLAPEIQAAFHISDTALLGMIGLVGVALVLTTLPAAGLGDRVRRTRVVAGGTFAVAACCALVPAVPNAFLMAVALTGTGIGVGCRLPNASSLLADGYPLAARARIFAIEGASRPIGQILGPVFAGLIAAAIAGPDAWRWVFLILAAPTGALAVAALFLKDPPRGQYEQKELLGELLAPDDDVPMVTLSAAFVRLKKVRSFYFIAVGVGVLGFALVSVPSLFSLLLQREYGYDASTRGWILALTWIGALVTVPLFASLGERRFARNPPDLLKLAAGLLFGYGVAVVIAMRLHAPAGLVIFYALANALQAASFVLTSPAIAAAVPARMRGQAFALVGLYVFLIGGFFGNLLAGALSDAIGERSALLVVVPPAALGGALFVLYGARFLKADIALVADELREEAFERDRIAAGAEVPVIQARNLDVSYGSVQVLFDCSIDVHEGETVALLGTNGAGKSTLLKTLLGLTSPDRGVVRLRGRTITYAEAEYRFARGVVAVRGGDGVFPGLSVEENLSLSFTTTEVPRHDRLQRTEEVLGTFPALVSRLHVNAGQLSGGQRQQLALARALLLRPDVLIIDELSLGLAPIVVQSLIEIVERLREQRQTMIIVEQSMNIALGLCDRALYMEKGRVVFEGTANEMRDEGDLVHTVFFGARGRP